MGDMAQPSNAASWVDPNDLTTSAGAVITTTSAAVPRFPADEPADAHALLHPVLQSEYAYLALLQAGNLPSLLDTDTDTDTDNSDDSEEVCSTRTARAHARPRTTPLYVGSERRFASSPLVAVVLASDAASSTSNAPPAEPAVPAEPVEPMGMWVIQPNTNTGRPGHHNGRALLIPTSPRRTPSTVSSPNTAQSATATVQESVSAAADTRAPAHTEGQGRAHDHQQGVHTDGRGRAHDQQQGAHEWIRGMGDLRRADAMALSNDAVLTLPSYQQEAMALSNDAVLTLSSYQQEASHPDANLASHSQSMNQNGATSGFEMCFAPGPATSVLGVPTKTRVESR